MINKNAIKKFLLLSGFHGEIKFFEEMISHTSFRIGGSGDLFIIPAGGNDMIKLFKTLSGEDIPCYILGGGTNLLVPDSGIRGVVIQTGPGMGDFNFRSESLIAEAGVSLPRLVHSVSEHGLSGLEFAAGIPGTIGGAVVMNAGCGGGDISQVVRRVRTFKPGTGIKDWVPKDCHFGYRSSRFRLAEEIVLEVEFELRRDNPAAIRKKMDDILSQRKAVLPLEYPSAGSIFKNPPENFAGRLIEEAGLKGERVGGAQISERHANVIVNLGSARSTEVEELIAVARGKVKELFGVKLDLELEIWR